MVAGDKPSLSSGTHSCCSPHQALVESSQASAVSCLCVPPEKLGAQGKGEERSGGGMGAA